MYVCMCVCVYIYTHTTLHSPSSKVNKCHSLFLSTDALPPAGEDYGGGGGVTGDPCPVRCLQAGERTGKAATGILRQAAPTAF